MERKKDIKNIAENIRYYRLLHHETQEELGDFLGYAATAIANYESGYRLPDVETLARLAEHYQILIDDFLK